MTEEKFNNPFAVLKDKLKDLPEGRSEKDQPKKGPARAVVRMERKGRGGKEVTVVDQLGLKGADIENLLKELKNALGCGGAVEQDTLVLQGDQRKRLPAILEAKGVKKVIVG